MKKTDDDEVVNEELTEEEIEVLSRGTLEIRSLPSCDCCQLSVVLWRNTMCAVNSLY